MDKWRLPPEASKIDWDAISNIPIGDYESRKLGIEGIESMIDTAIRFVIDKRDGHWSSAEDAMRLARLYRLLLSKCDYDANRFFSEKDEMAKKLTALKSEIKTRDAEINKVSDAKSALSKNLSEAQTLNEKAKQDIEKLKEEGKRKEGDITKLHKDIESLNKTIDRMNRDAMRAKTEMEALRREADAKETHLGRSDKNNEKVLTEQRYILEKYRAATDKNNDLTEKLAVAEKALEESQANYDKDISALKEHVVGLQRELEDVRLSRDKAEDALERREFEALSHLQEMQSLHQQEVEERDQQIAATRDQYLQMKAELEIMRRTESNEYELQEKDDIIERLRRENDELRNGGYGHTNYSTTSGGDPASPDTAHQRLAPAGSGAENAMLSKLLAEKSKLENENEALMTEVHAIEMRLEVQDAENLKLAKALKEYESGDEGLRNLRAEATEANRTVAILTEENQQLRERLSNVEDTVTMCEALKELCLRVGVSQEELDLLNDKGHVRFNEMEMLRQEVRSLKEEVEWVERERKHWMRKVRLQPLLDTKLRFELGLSADQLSQLDYIVDQMKSGGVVVDDGDYREKYYTEVKNHQRQMQVFNEQMRQRIETVLAAFLAGGGAAPAELEVIRQKMAQASADNEKAFNVSVVAQEAEAQAGSLQRRVHQQELSNQEAMSQIQDLRNQIIRLETERDLIREDLDLYRNLVLEGAVGAIDDDHIAAFEASANRSSAAPAPAAPAQHTPTVMVPIPSPIHDASSIAAPPDALNVSAASTANNGRPDANAKIREALMALRRRNVHAAPSSAEQTKLTAVLQQQVKAKELLLTEMERSVLREKEAVLIREGELKASKKTIAELTARLELKKEEAETASQIADANDAKVQELEKIKIDLQDACRRTLPTAHNELLQKIILLRQREGRLVERLREVMQDRDRLSERDREQERYIKEHLEVIRNFLSKGDEGTINPVMGGRATVLSTVLPNRSGQVQLEDEVLAELQRQMSLLSKGQMLKEDRQFLMETRRLYVDLQQQANIMEVMSEASQLRRELERATAELEEVRRGGSGATAAGSTATTAAATELFTRRLDAKEQEVHHLEKALKDAQSQIDTLREQLAAEGPASPNGDGDEASVQRDRNASTTESVAGGGVPTNANMRAADAIRRLEKELARYKSMNLGLVQSAIGEQASRKSLQIQLQARDREIMLLKEGGQTPAVSEFISAALKDSVVLMQQNELAQHMAKKMKLQLVVSEANFRVAANEAAGYKLSAYRLYKNYVEHVTKVIEVVRRLQRTCEGTMTAREVALQHKRIADAAARVDQIEEELTKVKVGASLSSETIRLLEDQLNLLKAKSPAESARTLASLSTETRAKLKGAERTNIALEEDVDHLRRKLARTEDYIKAMEHEIGRLEVTATGLDLGDDFAAKLKNLHDTVFTKTEAPPVALTVIPDATAQYLNGNTADDKIIRSYRDALDQQANLSRQCASLTEEVKQLQKDKIIAEGKINALREELSHAESRASAANGNIEAERTKARQREERMMAAHKAQSDVMQRAVDHNTSCLKEIINSKERAIAKLQEQLTTEREKFLEHQLLDTTRMERLHEQMFRENAAMVERFKASMAGPQGENVGRLPPSASAAASSSAGGVVQSVLETSLQSQVGALTREVVELRRSNQELREQNASMEVALSEQMLQNQRALREEMLKRQKEQHDQMLANDAMAALAVANAHQAALANAAAAGTNSAPPVAVNTVLPAMPPANLLPVESSLYALTHEQSIALDVLRRREAELKEQNNQQAAEILQLKTALREAPLNVPTMSDSMLKSFSMIPAHESLAELHAYISTLEGQLRSSQKAALDAQLAEQRNTIEWREQVANMKAEIAAQSANLEHSKSLLKSNEQLRSDMANIQSQHDKMVAATALLSQRLQQKDISHTEKEKQLQADIALAQKMGALQQDATEQLANLQRRMTSMQSDLQDRTRREEELLAKAKEAQRVAMDQHEKLLSRDIMIRELSLQNARLKDHIEKKRQPMLRCADRTTQTSEPLRSATAAEAIGSNIPTVETVLQLPPGFELAHPITPTAVAAAPTANNSQPTNSAGGSNVRVATTETTTTTTTVSSSVPQSVPCQTENKFVQTDPLPERLPSPQQKKGAEGRSSPARTPSPSATAATTIGAKTQDAPAQTAVPAANGASASSARRSVSLATAARKTGTGAARPPSSSSSPPAATNPIDPMEINRIVAKLQKDHGAELAKYRELSRRLERDLEELEGQKRREISALEASNKQLSSHANDLRARLSAMETARREEMLRFLQERNRQQISEGSSNKSTSTGKQRSLTTSQKTAIYADPTEAGELPSLPQKEVVSGDEKNVAISTATTTTVVESKTAPSSSTAQGFGVNSNTQQGREIAAAAQELRLHQMLRRSKEELEERTRQLVSTEKERDTARGELLDAKRRITNLVSHQQLLQSALTALEASTARSGNASSAQQKAGTSAALTQLSASIANNLNNLAPCSCGGVKQSVNPSLQFAPEDLTAPIPPEFTANPRDIRSHKREVMRLEAFADALRRELSVTKEVELRTHVMEKDKLLLRIRELETNAASTTPSAPSDAPAANALANTGALAQSEKDVLREKLNVIASLESRNLQLEGTVLDLRFERETLAMRCQRLEKHMADILEVDKANGQRENGGAISYKGGRPSSNPSASHTKEIGALETVIESLRAVVERVQAENAALRNSTINNSKYVEAMREVKALKQREKDLLEHLTLLSAKLQEHQTATAGAGGKMAEQHASLQRKLRQAQHTADQYQTELQELRARLGMPQSPPPAQRPDSVSNAVGGDAQDRRSNSSSGLPSNISPTQQQQLAQGGLNNWQHQQIEFIAQQQRHLEQIRQQPHVARSLNLSPFAAENHHLDRHHSGLQRM